MTERLPFHFSLSCIGEGNGNLLQCSCLENPRGGGAWWASVYGVAQSRTRLKRLSSSSRAFQMCFLIKKNKEKSHIAWCFFTFDWCFLFFKKSCGQIACHIGKNCGFLCTIILDDKNKIEVYVILIFLGIF